MLETTRESQPNALPFIELHDRMTRVVEQLPAKLTVVDATGHVVYRNAMSRADGVTTDDVRALVMSSKPRGYDGRPYRYDDLPAARSLRGETVAAEELVLHSGDELRPCIMGAAPLRDDAGRLIGAVLTEFAMDASFAQERQLFVSILLHELRAPTATAWAHLQLARQRLMRGVLEIEEPVLIAERHLRVLAGLLTELTPVAGVLTSMLHVNRSPTDFVEVVRSVLMRHGGKHHMRFFCGLSDLLANIDRDRIEQVVENLLTNAERYTPPGGSIVVIIEQRPVGMVRLQVRDTGIGIPEPDRSRVFQPFVRGSNVGARQGTGLGLYISRVIARRHDGDLMIGRTEGPGTTVELMVPIGGAR
jgi:signal transduction histidine kinase